MATKSGVDSVNLVFLQKSRKRIKPGTVFVFQLIFEPDKFRFGMVASTTLIMSSCDKVTLVYIYDYLGNSKEDFPDFAAKKLLLPPQAINTLGWSSGFFETVAYLDLDKHPEYKFPQHHFASFVRKGVYYDEFNNQVQDPVEPLGVHGLGNHRTVEDKVCDKLGYPCSED
ncbi:MAG: hypothetical protein H3C47_14050 [Candidatus Cloacimonetes bacterium]|nr:hypothetical protein [Candidatus Cloacimonadota bacterium]